MDWMSAYLEDPRRRRARLPKYAVPPAGRFIVAGLREVGFPPFYRLGQLLIEEFGESMLFTLVRLGERWFRLHERLSAEVLDVSFGELGALYAPVGRKEIEDLYLEWCGYLSRIGASRIPLDEFARRVARVIGYWAAERRWERRRRERLWETEKAKPIPRIKVEPIQINEALMLLEEGWRRRNPDMLKQAALRLVRFASQTPVPWERFDLEAASIEAAILNRFLLGT